MKNEKNQPKTTRKDAKRTKARERFREYATLAAEHLSVKSLENLIFTVGAYLVVYGHLSKERFWGEGQ